jgi:hypothetical protein
MISKNEALVIVVKLVVESMPDLIFLSIINNYRPVRFLILKSKFLMLG